MGRNLTAQNKKRTEKTRRGGRTGQKLNRSKLRKRRSCNRKEHREKGKTRRGTDGGTCLGSPRSKGIDFALGDGRLQYSLTKSVRSTVTDPSVYEYRQKFPIKSPFLPL